MIKKIGALFKKAVSSIIKKSPYRYVLEKDMVFLCKRVFSRDYEFKDKAGKTWLHLLQNGTAVIVNGYASDGCSPKFRIPFTSTAIGPWDGKINKKTGLPEAAEGFFPHDALYQFLDHPDMPLTRGEMDAIFRDALLSTHFPKWRTYLYYYAVKYFGGVYHSTMKSLRKSFTKG